MDQHSYADFRARRDATVWQRLNAVLRFLLLAAVWLVIMSLFIPPWKKLNAARADIDNLQAQVTDAKIVLAKQEREVSWLKNDPTYLETIARDRLDLMKEGETVFRLEQPGAAKTTPHKK